MAQKFLSNIELEAGLVDANGNTGTSGQILSSTGSGVDWIPQGDIVVGEADKAKTVILRVKNSTASAMTKGQVICEAVSASPPSGNLIEVALADNNGTNTMPALGVLNEDLDAAGGANDEGDAVMFGKVSGINTSAFSVGDEVFVDSTPGGLTITKPTGVKYIQKVGVVIRDDATNGTIEVFGAGRVNDVPTPLYVDHANQRLGINEQNPDKTFHVSGESKFQDTFPNLYLDSTNSTGVQNAILVTQNGGISPPRGFLKWATGQYQNYSEWRSYNAGYVSSYIKLPSQQSFGGNFTVNLEGTDRMVIHNTSGNVGFGTTSPDAKLHVTNYSSGSQPTIDGQTLILAESSPVSNAGANISVLSGTAGTASISFGDTSAEKRGAVNYLNGSDEMRLRTAAADRVTIKSDGDVGIATTSPSVKLQVGDGTVDQAARVYHSDNTYTEVRGYGLQMSRVTSYIRPTNNNVNTLNIGSGSNQWNNVYVEYNSSFRLRNGSSNRVYVSGSGAVGINTTNPQQKLDVNGKIYSSNYIVASVGSGGVGLTHNDGYGNANVTFNHVSGVPEQNGQSGRIEVNTDNTTTNGEMFFEVSGAPVTSGVAVGLSTALKLTPNNVDVPYRIRHLGDTDTWMQFDTDRIRLAAGGTTFLDSNTPPVSNSGTGIAGYVAKYTGASTIDDGIIYDSGTAIGIGTANPSSKLHVEGSGVAIANGSNTKTTLIPSGGGNSELTLKGQNFVHYVNYETSWNSFRYARFKSSYNTSDSELYLYKSDGSGGTAATTTISTGNSNFSGKVGIGNPSPSAFLDIDNIGSNVTAISVSGGTNEQFSVRTDGTNNGSMHVKGNDAVTRAFLAGAANGKSYIINELGIETTTPRGTLDVNGPLSVIGGTWTSGTTGADSVANTGIVLRRGKKLYSGIPSGANEDFYLRNLIEQTSSNAIIIGQGGTALITDIALKPGSSGNITFFGSGSEDMRINSSGNVGIGTTNPSAKVHASDGGTIPSLDAGTMFLASNTSGTGDYSSMSIMSGTSGIASLFFGDTDAENRGAVRYLNSTDEMRFRTANTDRVTIKSGGNVGIGTISPVGKLSVYRTDTTYAANISEARSRSSLYLKGSGNFDSELTFSSGSSNVQFIQAVNSAATSGRDIAINPFGGDVGIGTTNPSAHLHVTGSSQGAKIVSTQTIGLEVQGGGNSTDIAIFRDTAGNEEFSIDTNGTLFSLGMASSSSANANLMHNPTTGQIYRYTSSIRYKEDVTDLENAVDKIKELRPVNFKSKDTGEYNTGMIAEEVAEVMPEITYKADVEGFDTPQVDGITYEPLHAYYIKAIQELSSKIEQLESRIQTLENN